MCLAVAKVGAVCRLCREEFDRSCRGPGRGKAQERLEKAWSRELKRFRYCLVGVSLLLSCVKCCPRLAVNSEFFQCLCQASRSLVESATVWRTTGQEKVLGLNTGWALPLRLFDIWMSAQWKGDLE